MKGRLHAESLLRIPLLRQLLEDPETRLVARAVDARWEYEGILPRLGGFNPLEGAVYYPARSLLARWLRSPTGSARRHNENDFLVKEALFAVHDYLHVWAYRAMEGLLPEQHFARGPATRSAVEDRVFCHLVSEAAATVGLDYWFLCTVSLNEIRDIGTRTDFGLTADYHERFSGEYRRYCPELRVQSPDFFGFLAEFYCSSVFLGFDLRAIRESPLLLRWLDHELRYSRLQRRYARQWFSFLAKDGTGFSTEELDGPLAVDRPWKRKLLTELGALLWDKVKHDVTPAFPRGEAAPPWRAPRGKPVDFRFLNLNWFPSGEAARNLPASPDPASERFRLYQTIARIDYGSCSASERMAAVELGQSNPERLSALLSGKKRLPRQDGEPRDLFLLG